MFSGPRRAYDSGARTTSSGRELEAAALSRTARALEDCQRAWDSPGRDEQLPRALRQNQRLWTFFQAELASAECALPRELRVNLLQLSRFVDQRTFALLAEPSRDGLQALIDINRRIAEGLSERPQAADPAPSRV